MATFLLANGKQSKSHTEKLIEFLLHQRLLSLSFSVLMNVRTVPWPADRKFGSVSVRVKPSPAGWGMKRSSKLMKMLQMVGVEDELLVVKGSFNLHMNSVIATTLDLCELKQFSLFSNFAFLVLISLSNFCISVFRAISL